MAKENPKSSYRRLSSVAWTVTPSSPDAVRRVFQSVADVLEKMGRVAIPGVGVFHATTRKARRIRNPVTGELMQLPETRSVRFKPARNGVFR